jgi:hypothetical protein
VDFSKFICVCVYVCNCVSMFYLCCFTYVVYSKYVSMFTYVCECVCFLCVHTLSVRSYCSMNSSKVYYASSYVYVILNKTGWGLFSQQIYGSFKSLFFSLLDFPTGQWQPLKWQSNVLTKTALIRNCSNLQKCGLNLN